MSGAWALVLASLLWGTTGTAASFLPDDVSPIAIGASTMAFGGLLLFVVSARLSVAAFLNPQARHWLMIGAIGVFVYPLAFYSSMNLAGVAIGNVVSLGTGPVFAATLEWAIERRPLARLWVICTAIAIVGIALLALGGLDEGGAGDGVGNGGDGGDANLLLGVLLGCLAGVAYALYTYASSRAIATGQPQRGVIGGMFGLGAVALIPVLVGTGAPLAQSAESLGIATYLALGPMFVAYLLFGIAMRTLRSSTATTITLLEPFVATILAIAIVGERLDAIGWVGLVLILTAVTVLATARQTHRMESSS